MIAGKDAAETVDMTGKSVLNAYRVEKGGKVYYNTYNLLGVMTIGILWV